MGMIVSSSELKRALGIVGQAISPRPQSPILEEVLFESRGDKLFLTGSDNLTYIRASLPVESKEPQSFCVPFKPLVNCLTSIDDPVNISVQGSNVTFSDDKGGFTLKGEMARDYPKFPEISGEPAPCFDVTMLNISKRFLKKEDKQGLSNKFYTSVLVAWTPEEVDLFSSNDVTMMVLTEKNLDNVPPGEFYIPGEYAGIIASMVDVTNITVGTRAIFESDGLTVAVPINDAQTLPYRRLMDSQPGDVKIEFQKEDLLSALRLVSAVIVDFPICEIHVTGQKMKVSRPETPHGRSAERTIDIAYDGPDLILNLNPRELGDVLRHTDSPHLRYSPKKNIIEVYDEGNDGFYANQKLIIPELPPNKDS